MDRELRRLRRVWLSSGDPQARERYVVQLERHGATRRIEFPWVAEVAQLEARLERLSPEDVWLDPFDDNQVDWKPSPINHAVVGRTPHPVGSVRIQSDAPWLARPLRDADGERVLAAAASGELGGLAIAAPQHHALAERLGGEGLRVLELRDCRQLEPELLRRLPGLTHLTLRGADPRWIQEVAQLRRLEHLEVRDAELRDLAPLRALSGLRSLVLSTCRLSVGQLDALRELPLESLELAGSSGLAWGDLDALPVSLRELDLGFVRVEGAGEPALERLEALELLDLSCLEPPAPGLLKRAPLSLTNLGLVAVPADSMVGLERLTGLRRLDLSQGPTQPEWVDLQPLAALSRLSELTLKHSGIEDDDLAALAGLRELRSLNLAGNVGLSGVGLRHLRGAPRLTRIRLYGCYGLSPAGAAALAQLPALEQLSLSHAVSVYGDERLSDECLARFAGAPTLERLDLSGNRVSSRTVSELRLQLDGCRILAGSRLHPSEVSRAIASAQREEDPVAALASVAERWPDSALVAQGRADVAAALGDGVAAADHLTRLVELEPEPESYQRRGWLLWRIGRCAEAIEDFDRVLELDPARHFIYLWRAEARLMAGEHHEAIRDYTRLIELGSEGETAPVTWAAADQLYASRSAAYALAGDYHAACADAERAIGAAPEQPRGYASFGDALAKLGRREDAVAQFQRALEYAPDHEAARRGLVALGELA